MENKISYHAEGFLLGAHHGMSVDDVDYVCSKMKEFFKNNTN
jgi:dTDP-4-amino-4,6-dideoxygalactose transaminase